MKYIALIILLAFRCSGASVTLAWDKPDIGSPTSYTVFALASGESWSVPGITNTSVTLTNLVAGVRHTFFVVGVNDFGTSPQSNIVSVTPSDVIDVVIPDVKPPTGLQHTGVLLGSDTQWTLGLKWAASSNAIGYRVTSRSQDGSLFSEIKTASRTAQLQRLPYGTTNAITVSAFDNLGNESKPSDPLIAIVSAFPIGIKAVAYTNLFQLP